MSRLKEKLGELIPKLAQEVKTLIAEHGDRMVSHVSIKQAYGGMRGIKSLVTETSFLDPNEGIRFRGFNIPQVREKLPKAEGGRMMGFIKTPIDVAKWGIKAVTNTALYGLAIYGGINVAINTYNLVDYLKSLKPEQEIRQTVDTKIREYTIESIKGESGESIETKVQTKVESAYSRERKLLEELKKDENFTRDYAAWVKR